MKMNSLLIVYALFIVILVFQSGCALFAPDNQKVCERDADCGDPAIWVCEMGNFNRMICQCRNQVLMPENHCQPPSSCSSDTDCNDGKPCTEDVCSGGVCSNTVPPGYCSVSGSECPPEDGCHDTTICKDCQCIIGREKICDDANLCTTDSCDSATGCVFTPKNCDDGDVCTVDTCNATTGCVNSPSYTAPLSLSSRAGSEAEADGICMQPSKCSELRQLGIEMQQCPSASTDSESCCAATDQCCEAKGVNAACCPKSSPSTSCQPYKGKMLCRYEDCPESMPVKCFSFMVDGDMIVADVRKCCPTGSECGYSGALGDKLAQCVVPDKDPCPADRPQECMKPWPIGSGTNKGTRLCCKAKPLQTCAWKKEKIPSCVNIGCPEGSKLCKGTGDWEGDFNICCDEASEICFNSPGGLPRCLPKQPAESQSKNVEDCSEAQFVAYMDDLSASITAACTGTLQPFCSQCEKAYGMINPDTKQCYCDSTGSYFDPYTATCAID